jgi:hypothetical protein
MATQRPEQVLRTFSRGIGVTTVIAGFIAIVLALIFSFAMQIGYQKLLRGWLQEPNRWLPGSITPCP